MDLSVMLVVFIAFSFSFLFYLHRSTKLLREIRDELSKLNAKQASTR
jgi:hypothetical protein